jgi:hypothetical protein
MLANVHTDLVSALEDWERTPFYKIIVCYCFEDGFIPVMQHAIVDNLSHVDFIGWHTIGGITSHNRANDSCYYHFMVDGKVLQELIDYARDDYHFFTMALQTHALKN